MEGRGQESRCAASAAQPQSTPSAKKTPCLFQPHNGAIDTDKKKHLPVVTSYPRGFPSSQQQP